LKAVLDLSQIESAIYSILRILLTVKMFENSECSAAGSSSEENRETSRIINKMHIEILISF